MDLKTTQSLVQWVLGALYAGVRQQVMPVLSCVIMAWHLIKDGGNFTAQGSWTTAVTVLSAVTVSFLFIFFFAFLGFRKKSFWFSVVECGNLAIYSVGLKRLSLLKFTAPFHSLLLYTVHTMVVFKSHQNSL
jgi:hypothetical protein